MKKKLIILLFAACFGINSFAQVAADPLDFFYTDLVIWETMGLVGPLPAARPYPLQLVKQILETVIEQGDATQRGIAESHYGRFFNRFFSVGGKTQISYEFMSGDMQLEVAPAVDINLMLNRFLTVSGSLDIWATNRLPSDALLPEHQMSERDIIEDNARIGSFYILPSLNTSAAVGTSEYYFQVGLMRGSFGPFQENGVIVGQQALHSGQFTFVIHKPKWTFNLSLYALSATNDVKTDKFYPEKYLSLHSIDFHPFDWLSISVLESMMYGGRFDIMYLIPFSAYMISQGNTGFNDNSFIGGTFTVKPLKGLKIDGVLYADDLSFNDIIKLQWETKWRLAGQIGAAYAPPSSGIFTRVSFDYTMVTPYCYTHKADDNRNKYDINYQNYTHAGQSFGASLDPNSDRFNLKATFRPLEKLDIDLVGTLIRHGNVNENIGYKWVKEYLTKDIYNTDGSIHNNDDSLDSGHAYWDSTPFLTQNTLQYIWQVGFDAVCRLPVLKTGGYMVFRAGYRFECNINANINRSIYKYDETLDPDDDAAIEARAKEQLAVWRNSATGRELNHYVFVGFEYFY
ncbi:hypothetical protein K7I13_14885 [Brucepastera parasyntrophica]|uniref:hypothetical protein n=1 Tax=Brucepastera parasyntrophica TaxID=2880008 RepID=UPI00210DC180|nr:hypothetical protein [Brucepastera parasyntrophica]ULQ59718.1 hypothetical protein K7I13_14885 [Brucepastera parasyntrophica]